MSGGSRASRENPPANILCARRILSNASAGLFLIAPTAFLTVATRESTESFQFAMPSIQRLFGDNFDYLARTAPCLFRTSNTLLHFTRNRIARKTPQAHAHL
jgi:hypothetical protein